MKTKEEIITDIKTQLKGKPYFEICEILNAIQYQLMTEIIY